MKSRKLPEICEPSIPKAAVMMSVLGPLAVIAPFWFVFFIVGGAICVVAYALSSELKGAQAPVSYAVGFMLIFTGLGIGGASLFDVPDDDGNGDGPPVTWVPDFEVLIPTVVAGTSRDVATEFPASPFTACSAKPTTLTEMVWATSAYADRSNAKMEMQIAVDVDVAPTTATFQAPDCFLNDFSISLQNGRDANGDGAIDAATYFMRVRSITRTLMRDGNTSIQYPIFEWDGTNGWYIGAMKESASQAANGDWVSFYPAGVTDTTLPTGASPWRQLGSHAGGAAEFIAFWFVPHNYGYFGYTIPNVGDSIDVVVDVGTPEKFDSFEIAVKLTTRG